MEFRAIFYSCTRKLEVIRYQTISLPHITVHLPVYNLQLPHGRHGYGCQDGQDGQDGQDRQDGQVGLVGHDGQDLLNLRLKSSNYSTLICVFKHLKKIRSWGGGSKKNALYLSSIFQIKINKFSCLESNQFWLNWRTRKGPLEIN